jgi:N-acetylmuramoyl-L-alanine amidase
MAPLTFSREFMPLTKKRIAGLLLVALVFLCTGAAAHGSDTSAAYQRGLRLRSQLDATPQYRRTPAQYEAVLNAFRAVYHADRAAPEAPASVEAVAELLADEGRDLHNPDLLRAAVEQLAFLRRDFSASPFAESALMTQGEIEDRDLHDAEAARGYFLQFLETYASSPLAPEARVELRRLGGVAPASPSYMASSRYAQPAAVGAARPSTGSRWQPDFPGDQPPTAQTGQTAAARPPAEATDTDSTDTGPQPPGSRIVNGVPIARGSGSVAMPHRLVQVTGIRQWSTASYTRVAIDLTGEVPFEASRVANPDRVFFDLHGARLASTLTGHAVTVADGGFLERIRAAQFSNDVVRVVLDVTNVSDYSAFWLPNPARLIIDIHGRPPGAPPIEYARATSSPATPAAGAQAPPSRLQERDVPSRDMVAREGQNGSTGRAPAATMVAEGAAAQGRPTPRSQQAAAPDTFVAETAHASGAANNQPQRPLAAGDSVEAIAALSHQPGDVRATAAPTTAPVSAEVHPETSADVTQKPPAPSRKKRRHSQPEEESASAGTSVGTSVSGALSPEAPGVMARAAAPDANGSRSMVRALGLKINRIVIDAGHGGHDSGAIGPGGLEEKDVVLDVALRLGKLLKDRLGADVIYTRDNDTFIPLETRTAIANKAQADLFISIHANSSSDPTVRGVETYYLNFTSAPDALEVAARENAVSDESIHQLSSLVKQITLHDKIEESREFATDVQTSLYNGLEVDNPGMKNRGVKEAPFVVLIGANMPSILAEISFVTSTASAEDLREGAYRERIAESLYKGIAKYVHSLSSAQVDETAER